MAFVRAVGALRSRMYLYNVHCMRPSVLVAAGQAQFRFPHYRQGEFLYFLLGMVFLYILPLVVITFTYGGIIFHLHRKKVVTVIGNAGGNLFRTAASRGRSRSEPAGQCDAK